MLFPPFVNKADLENFYENEISDVYNELNCIKTIYEIEKWQSISLEDKLKQRHSYIETKKKLNQNTESNLELDYEICVIDLLNLIANFIKEISLEVKLNDLSSSEMLLFRLKNILYCELYAINRHKKIRKIGHIPYEGVVEPIFNKLKNTNFYTQYKLEIIRKSYQEMINLYRKNPYKKES